VKLRYQYLVNHILTLTLIRTDHDWDLHRGSQDGPLFRGSCSLSDSQSSERFGTFLEQSVCSFNSIISISFSLNLAEYFSPNRLLGGINHPLPPLSIPNHYSFSASSTTWPALYELQNPDNVISPNNLALGSSSSMMTFSSRTSSISSTMVPPMNDWCRQRHSAFSILGRLCTPSKLLF
jgi:hypothetical protein